MAADWWRLPVDQWQELLNDAQMQASFYDKAYRADGCHWWTGAISESGHGRLRAPRHLGNLVVAAHLYGYQLAAGVVPPDAQGRRPVLAHRCDNASCVNASHVRPRPGSFNAQEYQQRKGDLAGPLADRRGPAGRARAIRNVILSGLAAGLSAEEIQRKIQSVSDAGMPGIQGSLF
jgi:hypothetical protein